MNKLINTNEDFFYENRYNYVLDLVSKSKGQNIKFRLINVRCNKWLDFDLFTKNDFEYSKEIHRSILNNEIVFDIDIEKHKDNGELDLDASIQEAKIRALKVIILLKENNLTKYNIYYSGNKGFHIHLLFGNLNLSDDKLEKLLEIKSYNNDNFFKNIKLSICKLCNIDIGLNKDFSIDQAKFNKNTLIRMEGSINKKSDHWKSYLSEKELKDFGSNELFKANCKINKDYIQSINEIDNTFSEYIYKTLNKEFEIDLNKPQIVNRYGKRSFKCDIDKYSKVFIKYYITSQMHYVGRAYICFLYLMTKANKDDSIMFYNKYLLNKTPTGKLEELKFNNRFKDTWKQCEKAEKVGFYHILEYKCGISKEEFKRELENV